MSRGSPRPAGTRQAPTTVRIIGGTWRGRRLPVADAHGLRPTPDRIRETLFNWLAPVMPGARCIDLFAGTGALGLEALSRGAAHVHFMEHDRQAAAAIRDALGMLHAAERAEVEVRDALAGPIRTPPADIVFIDPPFAGAHHCAALNIAAPALAPEAYIYMEYPAGHQSGIESLLPPDFAILRAKKAGKVGYCLAQRRADSEYSEP